mmetsp:Transcript_123404/g.356738  ORF Transcript_123404/g.356738 Transcript_123404/m.356738 type:complete len:213 (+) Transcript_123404:197-835(+)
MMRPTRPEGRAGSPSRRTTKSPSRHEPSNNAKLRGRIARWPTLSTSTPKRPAVPGQMTRPTVPFSDASPRRPHKTTAWLPSHATKLFDASGGNSAPAEESTRIASPCCFAAAKQIGVSPIASRASEQALDESRAAQSRCRPSAAAMCKGVRCFPSATSTPARNSRSRAATTEWPRAAAMCSGVPPCTSRDSNAAPASSSNPQASASEQLAAT